MPTPKQWIATDIRMGGLLINRFGSMLLVNCDYDFIDSEDLPLPGIGSRTFAAEVEISDIPTDILNSLQIINNWVYNNILIVENMK